MTPAKLPTEPMHSFIENLSNYLVASKSLQRFVLKGFPISKLEAQLLKKALKTTKAPLVEVEITQNTFSTAEQMNSMKDFVAEMFDSKYRE